MVENTGKDLHYLGVVNSKNIEDHALLVGAAYRIVCTSDRKVELKRMNSDKALVSRTIVYEEKYDKEHTNYCSAIEVAVTDLIYSNDSSEYIGGLAKYLETMDKKHAYDAHLECFYYAIADCYATSNVRKSNSF